ncbi:hypothetical protein [Bermanella sp. R86510]|uniref:hypothetical protein n=1 Tax=unclassified Bermanella TaxID=2627862 RepID=UPI0037C96A07
MSEPIKFFAGTVQEWTREDEYAYGLWSFKYVLIGPSSQEINCASDAGLVSVILPSADTVSWEAGKYAWTLIREKDGEMVHVDRGYFYILANPSTVANPVDVRTHAERVLEAIEKRIESRVLSDHENYTIDGRSLNRIPMMDLAKLRQQYALKVRKEKENRGEVKRFTGRKLRLK